MQRNKQKKTFNQNCIFRKINIQTLNHNFLNSQIIGLNFIHNCINIEINILIINNNYLNSQIKYNERKSQLNE